MLFVYGYLRPGFKTWLRVDTWRNENYMGITWGLLGVFLEMDTGNEWLLVD